MSYFSAILLGLVQGIAEFFPISSSGHLQLVEYWLDLPVADLQAFAVVLHAGTLAALLVLFWSEWRAILVALRELVLCRTPSAQSRTALRMLLVLILATLPAALAGVFLGDWLDTLGFSAGVELATAYSFLLMASILALAQWQAQQQNFWQQLWHRITQAEITWHHALIMGLAQAAALIPAISRSGSTIAIGMLAGLTRAQAVQFSFLMLAPVTAGALILTGWEVAQGTLALPPAQFVLVGFLTTFIVSLLIGRVALDFLRSHSLYWFSSYLCLVAAALWIIA